jgi:hypothetical protein
MTYVRPKSGRSRKELKKTHMPNSNNGSLTIPDTEEVRADKANLADLAVVHSSYVDSSHLSILSVTC